MAYADAFATAAAHGAELWAADPELLLNRVGCLWRDLRV